VKTFGQESNAGAGGRSAVPPNVRMGDTGVIDEADDAVSRHPKEKPWF
jgi:hypothetical protein